MALGLRIVSSNVGGVPYLLTHGVNGKLVNSAEEIEEILDEGYFKTGDQVEIIIIRNNWTQ